jgi:tetratricopeptide (TPR) repeat protein
MEQTLIINAETVKAIKQKLADPDRIQEAHAAIKKMLDIKQALLWRADAGTCCGSLCNIATSLSREISILENAHNALEKGDNSQTIQALEEYEQLLEYKNKFGESKSC